LNFLIDQIMVRAYPKSITTFKFRSRTQQNSPLNLLEEETMKEIDALKFPDDVRYSQDHEWARKDGDVYTVGISDFAQDQLGDVVFVELPEAGGTFDKGQEFGTVESVKAVSELYMPVSGEVVAVNTDLEDNPEHVNDDPYGAGWMIKVRPADPGGYDGLMDREAYLAHVKG
jgi:glycine cleavage system H protein